jgi:vancomycin resistance protein VanJ
MWPTLIKYLGRFIVAGAICNTVLLLLSVLSPYVAIERDGLVSVCGLFFPVFFIIQVIGLVVIGFLRKKVFWLLLISLIVSLPAFSKIYGFNVLSGGDINEEEVITISSFNMQFSKPIAILSDNEATIHTQNFIKELEAYKDVDILAVQEYGMLSTYIMDSIFNYEYSHTVNNKAVGILSRYPIVDSGIVEFKSNKANTCLWADIAIKGDTLRCYSYHLESNRHDGQVPDVITENAPEEKSLSMMIGIVKYYNEFSLKRLGQVNMLIDHASNSPYPTILCGDFNDTAQSYIYSRMRDYYQDAFVEVGKGRGQTIESRLPLLRIDYIYGSYDIEFLTYDSDYTAYSDHYILKSQLRLK